MATYECVFIARQDVPAAQVDALTANFSTVIAENGGTVPRTEYWGLKTLTYRIKKNRKGHYVMMQLDAPSPAVAEMERLMLLNEDILRHLVVKVDELDENPSIMMQARSGRRDRDDRGDRDRGGDRDRDRDRGDRDRDRPRASAAPTEGVAP